MTAGFLISRVDNRRHDTGRRRSSPVVPEIHEDEVLDAIIPGKGSSTGGLFDILDSFRGEALAGSDVINYNEIHFLHCRTEMLWLGRWIHQPAPTV